ncbi:CCA tRNA nucleotidyltransferase [Propionibacteriaceae bacterium Y1923]
MPPTDSLTRDQRQALNDLLTATPVIGELGALYRAAGHDLYLVGGSVRDVLLGTLVHDLDFTTSADPGTTEKLLAGWADAVWDIGKDFGTISAAKKTVEDAYDNPVDWVIEVTTYRADNYRSDSRKPEVQFGESLTDDLIRRDFTINAMAIHASTGVFVDPYGGLDDLRAGLLRTPFEPQRSFSDDPLRMMRAARFSSQLGFTIEPATLAAMTDLADRIEIISAERVREELSRLLLTDNPRPGLAALVDSGLAERILPELPALQLETDEHHHHKDVYEHSLTVLEQSISLEKARGHDPDLVGRLAALLHDIGKPATRRFEEGGRVSFHHHDAVGAKLTRKRMKALRFSKDEIDAVSKLVDLHLRFHGYADVMDADGTGWTDSAVRRYVRDAGDQLERLHILTRSDCTTRNQRKATRLRRAYDDLEQRIEVLAEQEELDALRPDLDGTQIMEHLGIGPGPVVGQAYKYLLELRIERGPLDEQAVREALDQWWAARPS